MSFNRKVDTSTNDLFCNNCGKYGHSYKICKMPITSMGIIAFRIYEGKIQFLMIRRKDTLGYIDFMRGKYSLDQKHYVMNMLIQMTNFEKEQLIQKYYNIKNAHSTTLNDLNLKDKLVELINGVKTDKESYDLKSLIEETSNYESWVEPEWGFPKGRRNAQENDYDCAVREFSEETGYSQNVLKSIKNIIPLEENFTGSNYNSYRHKYYLNYISYEDSLKKHNYQKTELSGLCWKSYEECMDCIRPYNLEKKTILKNVYECLQCTNMVSTTKNI